jgi:pimeloyl-ACP methyl ester carboxylesterase
MSEPTRESVPLTDGTMSCLSWVGAGPLLHFAHANGFNAETYRALLSPLAADARIVASDARGHGRTRLPTAPGSQAGWTIFRDDLISLLDRIAPDGAVLAGHSMGATASLMAAALRPEKVRALVLVEPVLMPEGVGPGDNELARRAEKRRDRFDSVDEAFALYRGRGAFKTWPDAMLRDYLNGGLERIDGGMSLSCRPEWEAADFRTTPPGVSKLARDLRCPVTLIHAQDGTASQGEVAIFREWHPQTHVVMASGATHFLPMEFPGLVGDEIRKIAGQAA